jgi:hypothetical protein
MAEEKRPPDRRRRRRAAAAFTDLRERLTGACGKFAKVEDWRGFLAQHFTPLLNEFGDVLPPGARGLLEGAADVAEPTQAGIAKACEMLRGGLKSVAEEMAAQTGLQARIQDAIQTALRPVAGLVPDAVAKTTLGKALVALALAAVGVGSITGVAAVVMSGDGGPTQPAVGASASSTATAQPTQQPTTVVGGGLTPTSIDPCALLTKSEVDAALGRAVKDPRNVAGQPTCVYDDSMQPSGAPNPAGIGINLAFYTTGGAQDFSRFKDDASLPHTPVTSIGDDAFWTGGSLYVLRGDFYFDVTMYTSDPDAAKLETAKNIAQIVLSRLP